MEKRIKFKIISEISKNNDSTDLLYELSKYSNNIKTKKIDDSLIEYDLYLLPEVDIIKFKNYIKQNEFFHSF